MLATNKDTFFQATLSDKELEQILQRIDENLELRSVLKRGGSAEALPAAAPATLELGEIARHLQELHYNQAPLFVIKGSRWQQFLRRLVNMPIRLFGHKQLSFNRELLAALDALMAQLYSLRQLAEQQDKSRDALLPLQELLTSLEQSLQGVVDTAAVQAQHLDQIALRQKMFEAADQREHERWSEQFAHVKHMSELRYEQLAEQLAQIQGIPQQSRISSEEWSKQLSAVQALQAETQQLSSTQTALSAEIHGNAKWLESVALEQRGQSEWTTVLQKKVEWLSLSVREMAAAPEEANLPEPRVVDPENFQHLLAQMRGQIRVNVGCGEKPLDAYINVDLRELTGVDVLADVRRLPFEHGTLAEIASAHLIEHFREHQARQYVLPYWKSLLKKPEGVLRTICPNWEAMLQRLQDGRMSLAEFKLVTFGAQDYEGDDHFAMYTPATLRQLLLECGFGRTEVVVAERMNGICPEMEILAFV
jgi:hypothetical protein